MEQKSIDDMQPSITAKDSNKTKERKLSPLLEAGERDKVFNLGQSLDSKKVTSALGYLDLKQICYCLARALSRHIEFSRGQFFLDDMAKKQTDKEVENIEFSYNLGDKLKIDIDDAKRKDHTKRAAQKAEK